MASSKCRLRDGLLMILLMYSSEQSHQALSARFVHPLRANSAFACSMVSSGCVVFFLVAITYPGFIDMNYRSLYEFLVKVQLAWPARPGGARWGHHVVDRGEADSITRSPRGRRDKLPGKSPRKSQER